jgi:hypothetical protein
MTSRTGVSPPSRGRRAPWLVTALAPLLLATSCPAFVRVRVEPGPARGYRLARTPADSAAVDAREYAVLNTPLSCGHLRTRWPDAMHSPVTRERTLLGLLGLSLGAIALLFSETD